MKIFARAIIKFVDDRKAARKRRFEAELYELIHGSHDYFEKTPGR